MKALAPLVLALVAADGIVPSGAACLGCDGVTPSTAVDLEGGGMSVPGGGAETIADLYNRNFTDPVYALPTCTAGTGCEMLCYPVGTTWTCVDETGASIGVTQGTGAVAWSSPWGATLDDVTDAAAPRLTSSFDAVLAGAHTVVVGAYSTTNTYSYQFPVAAEATSGSNWQMRQEGASYKFYAGLYEAVYPDPTGPLRGFGVFSGRSNSGNSTWTIRANGLENADSVGSWTDPSGTTWWFGRGIGGCASGCPLRGPLRFVAAYSVEKTPSELLAIERAMYGIPEDANSPIEFSRTGTTWDVYLGRAVPYGPQTPVLSARGLEFDRGSSGATKNNSGWALDPLDATTWTAIGTPTTTANAAAGPWDSWKGGSSADLIVDDAAGTWEGYEATQNCADTVAAGTYTVSCYVRTGTSGVTTDQVSLGIVTDGTGSTDCATTGLQSSYWRVECSADVGGSPTYVRGRIRVGDAAADTGSIIVAQCQCDAMDFPGRLRVQDEAVDFARWTIPATEDATWPTGETKGGEAEVVFTIDHNHPTRGDFYEYLLDAENVDETDHWMGIFLTFTDQLTAPKIRVALRPDNAIPTIGDQTDTDTYSSDLSTLQAYQPYVVRFRWMPMGVLGGYARVAHYIYFDECDDLDTCRATTLVGSDTSGDKLAAVGAPGGGVSLGRRLEDEIGLLHGAISRVRVSEVE